MQTYKGSVFVFCSSLFLYLLLKRLFVQNDEQQELRLKQEKLYRAIIDNGNDMITLTNADGKILYISDNVCELMGFRAEELLGVAYITLVHPDDINAVRIMREKLTHSQDVPFLLEMRLKNRKGEYIWVECKTINKINDPLLKAIIGNTRIITDRIEHAQALRDSEELFRATFDQAPVGLIFTDLKGNFIRVNQKQLDMTGYTSEEFSKLNFLELTHPEDFKNDYLEFQKLIYGKIDHYSVTKRIVRKDQSVLWVMKNASLIKNSTGEPLYVNHAMQDITDKVNTDTELAYRNQELDTYIYRSSHDLRGPISTIMGLSMYAQSEVTDAVCKNYFENITRVASSMDKLLGNLMAVAQIRESAVNISTIDLKELIHDCIARQNNVYGHTEYEVETMCSKEIRINTDIDLVGIILQNLIDNANKFRIPNNSDHHVSIKCCCDNGKLKIAVKDNGIGVSADDQKRMFDLYYRGKHPIAGNGIGLYVVRGAVDKLNGKISVTSCEGKGTELCISIPNCCMVAN